MWGFWEGANWIPVSSLFRRAWTPAARVYRELVFKTWWTKWEGTADVDGRCDMRAFYDRQRVMSGGKETVVTLRKKDGKASVSLR